MGSKQFLSVVRELQVNYACSTTYDGKAMLKEKYGAINISKFPRFSGFSFSFRRGGGYTKRFFSHEEVLFMTLCPFVVSTTSVNMILSLNTVGNRYVHKKFVFINTYLLN